VQKCSSTEGIGYSSVDGSKVGLGTMVEDTLGCVVELIEDCELEALVDILDSVSIWMVESLEHWRHLHGVIDSRN